MKHPFYKITLLLVLVASTLAAQAQFTVSGNVTDSRGDALIGVTVAVANSNAGTVTDINGDYSISISGTTAVLTFSYVGHRSQAKDVNASTGQVNVSLEETTADLDEVIISGLATTIKRSNSANSVSEVSADELTGITTQSTLDGALYAKFTGVQIIANSGSPGGGYNMRMRGVTSILGAAQPLFIIDGIYMDNSSIPAGINTVTGAAAGGNTAIYDQDNPTNRLADLDPGDIESIEILKGSSAAAIYGQRASGGVVIITTKKGKLMQGGANIQLTQSLGFQKALNLLGVREWDSDKVTAYYGPDEVANYEAAAADGLLHDYEEELFGNKGLLSDTRLSVSGGTEKTSFYASGSYKNEEGIVKNTGYEKTNLRLNINHSLNSRIEIGISTNYVKSLADRGLFGNDNLSTTMGISLASTPTWAQLFPDEQGNYPNNPYSAANFLQTRDLMTNSEGVDRFIGGTNATIKLVSTDRNSLKLLLNGGMDAYTLRTNAIFPRELQFEKEGNGTNGASIQGLATNFINNESAFLVHTFFPASQKFSLRTQGGLGRYSRKFNHTIITATQLIGTQTNVDQAGSVALDQIRSEQLDLSGFGQEEFNYSDMIIATVGIRGDKSSNNGDVNKVYWFPKASLAINIGEMNFWSMDNWNQLKLRVAYGQSGNFAPYGAKFTSLANNIIEGNAGSLINAAQGNSTVGPELQSEIELGADFGFLDSRFEVEFTYYIKSVKDLLISVRVPASSGFTNKRTNAADLENKGVEITFNADFIKTENFSWLSSASFWMNRSEITRLEVPAFAIGSFGATLGTYYIDTNKSASQIVGIGPADQIDENSPYVKWGDSEPDFQMSFMEELSYKNWSLAFVLHWKKGGEGINLTTLLTDIFGTSADYDDTNLDPTGSLTNGDYRLSLLGTSAEAMVEDAGYIRLREVGLHYSFNGKKLSESTNGAIRGLKLGISASNLINIFDYSGYDPEVSNFGANNISTGVEVNPYPSAKRFYASLAVNF